MTRAGTYAARALLVALGAFAGLVLAARVLGAMRATALYGTPLSRTMFERSDVPTIPYLYRPGQRGFTDSHGLLRPREAHPARRPGVRRVLVVGDSVSAIVMDELPSAQHLYTTLLEAELSARAGREVEVFNLSSPGLSLRQEVELLRARLPALQPDEVVVAYCYNDPVETDISEFPNVTGSLLAPFSAFRRLASYRRDLRSEAAWYDGRSDIYRALAASFGALAAVAPRGRTSVVGLPRLDPDPRGQAHLPVAARLSRAHGLRYLDVLPALTPRLGSFMNAARTDPIHYNAAGHRALAAALADLLDRP